MTNGVQFIKTKDVDGTYYYYDVKDGIKHFVKFECDYARVDLDTNDVDDDSNGRDFIFDRENKPVYVYSTSSEIGLVVGLERKCLEGDKIEFVYSVYGDLFYEYDMKNPDSNESHNWGFESAISLINPEPLIIITDKHMTVGDVFYAYITAFNIVKD